MLRWTPPKDNFIVPQLMFFSSISNVLKLDNLMHYLHARETWFSIWFYYSRVWGNKSKQNCTSQQDMHY